MIEIDDVSSRARMEYGLLNQVKQQLNGGKCHGQGGWGGGRGAVAKFISRGERVGWQHYW